MKLYLLKQEENTGYDTYDSIVVAANSREEARQILPASYLKWEDAYCTWVENPSQLDVTYLGEAAEGIKEGLILSSFNAG